MDRPFRLTVGAEEKRAHDIVVFFLLAVLMAFQERLLALTSKSVWSTGRERMTETVLEGLCGQAGAAGWDGRWFCNVVARDVVFGWRHCIRFIVGISDR